MRTPWWHGLDLRVLRHVRGVLRRRGLELTLVEQRPDESAAFASLDGGDGAGLAVIAPGRALDQLVGEPFGHQLRHRLVAVDRGEHDRGRPRLRVFGRREVHGVDRTAEHAVADDELAAETHSSFFPITVATP